MFTITTTTTATTIIIITATKPLTTTTMATTPPIPTTSENSPGVVSASTLFTHTSTNRNADSIQICPHPGLTFTSDFGLADHLRIRLNEIGEPVTEAPHTLGPSALYVGNAKGRSVTA
ncbi:hypothetical protein SprV_0802474700 [Sparganum proliferum]